MKDYYRILEVSPNALQERIKEQYRFLVHAWHPDKFPNPTQKAKAEEKIKEINEAYEVLSDPMKRKRYDEQLRSYSPPWPSPTRPSSPQPSPTRPSSPQPSPTRPSSPRPSPTRPSPLLSMFRLLIESETRLIAWLDEVITKVWLSLKESELFLLIAGVIGSVLLMAGSFYLMEHVTTFSFAWWIGALVFGLSSILVGSFIYYIVLPFILFLLALLMMVWGIVEIVRYFIQHPY